MMGHYSLALYLGIFPTICIKGQLSYAQTVDTILQALSFLFPAPPKSLGAKSVGLALPTSLGRLELYDMTLL